MIAKMKDAIDQGAKKQEQTENDNIMKNIASELILKAAKPAQPYAFNSLPKTAIKPEHIPFPVNIALPQSMLDKLAAMKKQETQPKVNPLVDPALLQEFKKDHGKVKKPYSTPTDISKMTVDDYMDAWENKDWKTTEAYCDAVRKGILPPGTVTPSQALRMQNINFSNMPQFGKDVIGGLAGILDGSSMNLMDLLRRFGISGKGPSDPLVENAFDRLQKEAPNGFTFGDKAGQIFPMLATGGLLAGLEAPAAGLMNLIGNPIVKKGLVDAASMGLPTLISDINAGEPAGQTLLDTFQNATTGGLFGAGGQMISDVLPQAGTIAYQRLLESGGIAGAFAPQIAKIAGILNPEGQAAADNFGLKNGFNKVSNVSKADAIYNTEELPYIIKKSVKDFFKGGSNAYSEFSVEKLPNGDYLAKMEKPGYVPGSKAIYYKEISAEGTSVVYKDTFSPNGELVHRKSK